MSDNRPEEFSTTGPVRLSELLAPQRIDTGCEVRSKKRVLERLAELLTCDAPDISTMTVFQTLFERERLGSTGLGKGFALPHGRLDGLDSPIGAIAVLQQPLDYDASDGQPVHFVFALLVPQQTNEQHLQILASLAGTFSDVDRAASLARARSKEEIYRLFKDWDMEGT